MKTMTNLISKKIFWLYALSLLSTVTYADDFSGTCTGTITTVGSPHQLISNCTVPVGQTLTIEPGVVLNSVGWDLTVQGTLQVNGVVGNESVFNNVDLVASSGSVMNMDNAIITDRFITYNLGSNGSVTNSELVNVSMAVTNALLSGITDNNYNNSTLSVTNASPPITGNTFSTLSATDSHCLIWIIDGSPTVDNNSFPVAKRAICVDGNSAGAALPTITNNTISSSSSWGGISMIGTAQPAISNNTIEVRTWRGMYYQETSAGTATNNTINFAAGTGSSRSGIHLVGDASPIITANQINDDTSRDDFGLSVLVTNLSTVQLTGNTVECSGGDTPLQTDADVILRTGFGGAINNTYNCANSKDLQLTGTLTDDVTLAPIDGESVFRFTGALTVPLGNSITIPNTVTVNGAGQLLHINGSASVAGVAGTPAQVSNIHFRTNSGGSLTIDQASLTTGSVTYFAGSSGSVTNSELVNASMTVTSALLSITDNNYNNSTLFVTSASPPINANTFSTTSTSNGHCLLSITDGSSTVDNNTFPVAKRGICVDGNSAGAALPTISNNTISSSSTFGGISITGTAQPDVSLNNIEVRTGTGLYYQETSAGTADNNTISFAAGTGSSRSGIHLVGNASPIVTTNQINDDTSRDDFGLSALVTSLSNLQLTGNTVECSGGDTPLRVDADVVLRADFTGAINNTYNCANGNDLQLAGTLADNITMAPIDGESAFRFISHVTVPIGQNITIPNTITLNGANWDLRVSGSANVTGVAGTPAQVSNVRFEANSGGSLSIDQSILTAGSVTYFAGSSGSVTNSELVNASMTVTNALLSGITDNNYNNSTLSVTSASPPINANTFSTTSTSNGHCLLSITDGSSTVDNNTFPVAKRGICVDGNSAGAALPTISNNTISSSSTFGGISITGTAQPDISLNNIEVRTGIGLYYSETSAGTADNNTISFAAGTGSSRSGIHLVGNASPIVTANQINDDTSRDDFGLSALVTSLSNLQLTGNTVECSGGDTPLRVDADVVLRTDFTGAINNTYNCSNSKDLQLTGTLTSDIDLASIDGESAFRFISHVTVPVGQSITIPNTITLNGANWDLRVSGTANVTGVAGTPAQVSNVRFEANSGGTLSIDQATLTGGSVSYFAGSSGAVTNTELLNSSMVLSSALLSITNNNFNNSTLSVTSASPPITGNNFSTLSASNSHCLILITDGSPLIDTNTFPVAKRGICVDGNSAGAALPTITNNTISSSSTVGGISVFGTAQPAISANNIEVRTGVGLYYQETSAGTANNNTITFAAGTSSSRSGIHLVGNASPIVTANQINDDTSRDDFGLSALVTSLSNLQLTGNTVECSGGDTPLRVDADVVLRADFTGAINNTYNCSNSKDLQLTGTLTSDIDLAFIDGESAFRFIGHVTVPVGQNITIPNTITLNGANWDLRVSGTANVTGVAGTPAQVSNVRFEANSGSSLSIDQATLTGGSVTYFSGSSGSMSNSDFTSTNLTISDNITIDNNSGTNSPVTYSNGGSGTFSNNVWDGPVSGIGINVTSATPTLSNNILSNMLYAVRLNSATNVSMLGNEFMDNGTAIDIFNGSTLSTANANIFDNNNTSIWLRNADALFSAFPVDFNTNSFIGPINKNLLVLPGTINISGTFPTSKIPFANTSGLTINGAADVFLPASTTIASNTSRQIIVSAGSRLIAVGTTTLPVIFTDLVPKDGSRWSGLVVRDNNSELTNCIIEFSAADGLRLENASIPINGCRISDNNGDGIELTGNSEPLITASAITGNIGDGINVNLLAAPTLPLTIQQNTFFSNAAFGINNRLTTFDIAGTLNYWGHDSGPNDSSDDTATGGLYNPTGSGQRVSDNVLYDPWIRIGPSQEGSMTPLGGGGQIGTVGETLLNPMVIQVDSNLGTPLPGIDVIFSIVQGDATILETQPVQTDALGQASATIQLGITVGDVLITATARDVNSPLATFMAEASAPCLVFMKMEPFTLLVSSDDPGQLGDVNNDGVVNNQDSVLILAVLDSLIAADSELVANYYSSGDINQDGIIDKGDALVIQGIQIGSLGQ